jgi:three-Cys-motif partner protein
MTQPARWSAWEVNVAELDTVWKLEPHTQAKHELLRRYLNGWYPILSRWNGRIVFLDGFAGPGIYENGEPGSPTVALSTLLDHSYYSNMSNNCEFLSIFNEADQKRAEKLQQVVDGLKAEYQPWPAKISILVVQNKFENTAEDLLATLEQQKANLAPTFAFVDPFGVSGMPMDLLRRLLSFDRCELFVYFNYNTVNRFATAGNIDSHLTSLFGTDEFKGVAGLKGANRKAFLHDLYQTQLINVCGFPYVQSFEMIKSTGHTGYYLFYGTRNIRGIQVMKEAMWKVAPGGDYMFSDLLAGQDVLFTPTVDTLPLQAELARHFGGQTVSIEKIEEFVLINTPYAASHVKKLTLKPMQEEGWITSPNQRRRNTYPTGTLLTFPPI